jgi:NADH:ubiquinone oxidoreductase subunit 6 (subunit J)
VKKIFLFMACIQVLFAEASVGLEDQKAVEQANTIRWKAGLFAGTVLLAVITGIVVIAVDGGTPNHHSSHPHVDCHPHHKPHHHH